MVIISLSKEYFIFLLFLCSSFLTASSFRVWFFWGAFELWILKTYSFLFPLEAADVEVWTFLVQFFCSLSFWHSSASLTDSISLDKDLVLTPITICLISSLRLALHMSTTELWEIDSLYLLDEARHLLMKAWADSFSPCLVWQSEFNFIGWSSSWKVGTFLVKRPCRKRIFW